MFNFKCTVLEDYLEFDAQTGTKMKLKSSTFCFYTCFLFCFTFSVSKTRKTRHTSSKMSPNEQSDPRLVSSNNEPHHHYDRISHSKYRDMFFRQLPSTRSLTKPSWLKYGCIRSNIKRGRPILDEKPGIETLTNGRVPTLRIL